MATEKPVREGRVCGGGGEGCECREGKGSGGRGGEERGVGGWRGKRGLRGRDEGGEKLGVVSKFLCECVCVRVHLYTHTYVRLDTDGYTQSSTCTDTHTHTCTYTHRRTYVPPNILTEESRMANAPNHSAGDWRNIV